jgi:hypothetical protein
MRINQRNSLQLLYSQGNLRQLKVEQSRIHKLKQKHYRVQLTSLLMMKIQNTKKVTLKRRRKLTRSKAGMMMRILLCLDLRPAEARSQERKKVKMLWRMKSSRMQLMK